MDVDDTGVGIGGNGGGLQRLEEADVTIDAVVGPAWKSIDDGGLLTGLLLVLLLRRLPSNAVKSFGLLIPSSCMIESDEGVPTDGGDDGDDDAGGGSCNVGGTIAETCVI